MKVICVLLTARPAKGRGGNPRLRRDGRELTYLSYRETLTPRARVGAWEGAAVGVLSLFKKTPTRLTWGLAFVRERRLSLRRGVGFRTSCKPNANTPLPSPCPPCPDPSQVPFVSPFRGRERAVMTLRWGRKGRRSTGVTKSPVAPPHFLGRPCPVELCRRVPEPLGDLAPTRVAADSCRAYRET